MNPEATPEVLAAIDAAKDEALAIVRGDLPLTDGAVQRARDAVAAQEALYGPVTRRH
jgi:hypothetical protein